MYDQPFIYLSDCLKYIRPYICIYTYDFDSFANCHWFGFVNTYNRFPINYCGIAMFFGAMLL